MSRPLRFAFVGCGAIARFHLRALQSSHHVTEVCAAVDIRRRNAQEFIEHLQNPHDCKVFSSLNECLEWGQFDAAILMVPHHLHRHYATACLRAGVHVLLEKPLAHTMQACQQLLDVAHESDRVFMVGEQSPFWPEVVKAGELIEQGEIGRPYFATANYWESLGSATFLDESHFDAGGNWRFDPSLSGGGILIDGATHWVRPLRLWFGDVQEVVGVVDYPLKQSKCESLAHSILRFSSGISATLYCHFMQIPMHPLPFFQVFGEKGEITIHGSFDGGMTVRNHDNPDGYQINSLGGFSAAFGPQMEVFLNAVANGNKLPDSGTEALKEVMVAMATYKSVNSKKWEKVTIENCL